MLHLIYVYSIKRAGIQVIKIACGNTQPGCRYRIFARTGRIKTARSFAAAGKQRFYAPWNSSSGAGYILNDKQRQTLHRANTCVESRFTTVTAPDYKIETRKSPLPAFCLPVN